MKPELFHALVSGEKRGLTSGSLRRLLWLAQWPYALTVRLRNRRYDTGTWPVHRTEVPIISVGNLTLGGTGKTPCVEWIARFLREHDWAVTILSRGYGSEAGRNDEAMVLEENLPDVPHLQGVDRAALAEIAVEELASEVLILDDGFQHRRLRRDLDIVLIDVSNPWGFDALFPRGLLREPLTSLRRADIVVLTRCDRLSEDVARSITERVGQYAPGVPVVRTIHRPRGLIGGDGVSPPEELTGRRVVGFAGIGNPDAFRKTLDKLGAEVVTLRCFPDHHPYDRADVEELHRWAAGFSNVEVVTTQKDWVKLRLDELGGHRLRALTIGMEFLDGQDVFEHRLLAAIRTTIGGTDATV